MGRPLVPESVWSQALRPLESDRCRHDPHAPCKYWCTKRRGLAGYPLSEDDAVWVGLTRAAPQSGGWRFAYFPDDAVADRPELSPQDSHLLETLMAVDVSRSMTAFMDRST